MVGSSTEELVSQSGLWSLERDANSVRRRQRADVTGRRSRGCWVRAVGCASPAGLCPGSAPPSPAPQAEARPHFRERLFDTSYQS
ncbi:hypothetical protein H8959_007710 [Pygathrix nigripes]